MKILFALGLVISSVSASAADFVPGGECKLEGERKYVQASDTTDDVFVCESGAWKYLYTRDNADLED